MLRCDKYGALTRVDSDTIAREEAGLGEDAMEVELDPLTLLEMGMGEDVIQLEVRVFLSAMSRIAVYLYIL